LKFTFWICKYKSMFVKYSPRRVCIKVVNNVLIIVLISIGFIVRGHSLPPFILFLHILLLNVWENLSSKSLTIQWVNCSSLKFSFCLFCSLFFFAQYGAKTHESLFLVVRAFIYYNRQQLILSIQSKWLIKTCATLCHTLCSRRSSGQ
jgi:hypothetical protein